MKLLHVVTGALSASFAPYWANWVRQQRPDLEVRYLLTPSAERFVTRTALAAVSGADVGPDTWDRDPSHALHVELADWADAVTVYPASLSYLARVAMGMADSPSLLTIACADVPVVLAPALPPGAARGEVYADHLAAIDRRSNVHVVAPHPVISATGGDHAAMSPPPFTVALAAATTALDHAGTTRPSRTEVA